MFYIFAELLLNSGETTFISVIFARLEANVGYLEAKRKY